MPDENVEKRISTAVIFPCMFPVNLVMFQLIDLLWFFRKFSDLLIYASRSTCMNFQFKIHGYFSLYNVFVEETDPKFGVDNCFTIYAGNKILILGARYVMLVFEV